MSRFQRAIYDQLVVASGCDENDVMEARISECRVELDIVDFVDPGWPVRTIIVEVIGGASRPRAVGVASR
jgi:hypothetical protein